MTHRRQFILTVVPAALAVGATALVIEPARAQPAKADENDAAAKGIGYKHDASQVDPAKYPSFGKGKVCSGCQLYAAKAGEAWGACPIVGGKLVNANGWCTAWVKKA